MLTPEQNEILNAVEKSTHAVFDLDFIDRVNAAFGTNLRGERHSELEHGGFKGYEGPDCYGLAGFRIAPAIASHLGVQYLEKLGRGSDARSAIEAIRAHLRGS